MKLKKISFKLDSKLIKEINIKTNKMMKKNIIKNIINTIKIKYMNTNRKNQKMILTQKINSNFLILSEKIVSSKKKKKKKNKFNKKRLLILLETINGMPVRVLIEIKKKM